MQSIFTRIANIRNYNKCKIFWDKSPSWFLNNLKLPSFYSGNFKIFKNVLGQFIPNRPPKHVITTTNQNRLHTEQLGVTFYTICDLLTLSSRRFLSYRSQFINPLSANFTKWSNTLKQLSWVCLTILRDWRLKG